MEKKENERTQAPPKLREEKRKALLLSGAHTAVTGANESKKHRKARFPHKLFPSKVCCEIQISNPQDRWLPVHMMP
jgi:hypothetical protein